MLKVFLMSLSEPAVLSPSSGFFFFFLLIFPRNPLKTPDP